MTMIGSGPNQVPTNADLGTMAYEDVSRLVDFGYINLGAICFCKSSGIVAIGAVVDGATLSPSGVAGNVGSAFPTGTIWRCLGTTTTTSDVTLFQRIE